MNYSEIEDRRLVTMLINGDKGAEEYFIAALAAPLVRVCPRFSECVKCSIGLDAITSRLWTICSKNDYARLRLFRGDSSLRTYLSFIVREAINAEVRIVKGLVDVQPVDDPGFFEESETIDERRKTEIADELDEASRMISKLWEKNPRQVLALLMSEHLGMSGNEIGCFLGENRANVNQLKKRAVEKMVEIRNGEECAK